MTVLSKLVGGKGVNLITLNKSGFAVPEFILLESDWFLQFIQNNCLADAISQNISKASHDNFRDISARIQLSIKNGILSDDFSLHVKNAISNIKSNKLAIRSSSADEDGSKYSFAGIFESYLNIENSLQAALKAIKNIWSSTFSNKAIYYRIKNGFHGMPRMAIIIQKMIQCDRYGLVFTHNPLDESEIVIEEYFKINHVNRTHFIKRDYLILPQYDYDFKYVFSYDSLILNSLKIAQLFNHHQDIEWCLEKNRLYFLQSRPITTHI